MSAYRCFLASTVTPLTRPGATGAAAGFWLFPKQLEIISMWQSHHHVVHTATPPSSPLSFSSVKNGDTSLSTAACIPAADSAVSARPPHRQVDNEDIRSSNIVHISSDDARPASCFSGKRNAPRPSGEKLPSFFQQNPSSVGNT